MYVAQGDSRWVCLSAQPMCAAPLPASLLGGGAHPLASLQIRRVRGVLEQPPPLPGCGVASAPFHCLTCACRYIYIIFIIMLIHQL